MISAGDRWSTWGLKDGTKDIDLVLQEKDDRDVIREVLLRHQYKVEWELPGYQGLDANLMRRRGHVGVDLFFIRIMERFHLSGPMMERAEGPYRFGELGVHHCSNEDIFLLKTITYRPDDDDDVVTLLRTGLDPQIIRQEVEVQESIAPNNWPTRVYNALERIEERKGVDIPLKADLFG